MQRLERHLELHPVWRVVLWLALFGVLMFARLPARYLQPFFFAEEGPLYFHHAYHHSVLDALRTTKLGYFAAWTNLACTLAAHAVSLEYAPLVTTAMGTLLWAWLLVLVALPSGPLPSHGARLLAVAVLLLMPVHAGKTHASFALFYFCFATAVVLVSDGGTAPQRWLRRLTLTFAGITGVQALFLAPLFVWKYLRGGRSREVLVQIAILAAGGLLQVGVLAWTLRYYPEEVSSKRWVALEPGVLGAAVVARSLVAPLAGVAAMDASGAWFLAVLEAGGGSLRHTATVVGVLAGTALVVWLIVGPPQRRTPTTRLLALGYVVVVLLSFLAAITNQEGTKSQFIVDHARYFAAPNLMLGLAWLVHAANPAGGPWRVVYRVLTAWVLVVGAYVYVRQPDPNLVSGPDWKQELAVWQEAPAQHAIHTWPVPWNMRLRPRVRRAALR